MGGDWETTFQNWAKPPGKTEQDRMENAERQIRKAIHASQKLSTRDIKIFSQGSYSNRVNVRQDSDVDIGVCCYDVFFPKYPDDNVKAALNHIDDAYTYFNFKNEIQEALEGYFGRASVKRGNKAFDIKANSYRVEADVAAFFEYRRYTSSAKYLSGVQLIPDFPPPERIRNWPQQHYDNGVAKNTSTNRCYKPMVRILKNLKNEMEDNGTQSAVAIPSFLVECLTWNVPDSYFGHKTYEGEVRAILAYLFNNTIKDEDCSEWGEVSDLKYLFRSTQPWTRKQAHKFIGDAWDYIGFK
jgi:hypothetical protein